MTEHAIQRQVRSSGERWRIGLSILLLHGFVIAALINGTTTTDWLIFAVVYTIQSIGVGIGMHRYFAHRSFRTSRQFQFALGLAAASVFGNAVSFAGKHRLHHQHVDSEKDVHTPLHGIWACWIGSLLDNGYTDEEILRKVPDLTRYPELMWLYRHPRIPGLILMGIAWLIGGWTAAAVGVGLGSLLMLHKSSAVNYLAHKYGSRRFDTPDQSTNNWLMAILAFGEGWHNNHHCYPRSARAGFYWWEIDIYYWLICLFEKLGLVWSVIRPPVEAYSTSQDEPQNTPGIRMSP